MTQHSVHVDEYVESDEERKRREYMEEEDRQIAEYREQWEAWQSVRTQQVVAFDCQQVADIAREINEWLRKNPTWRLVEVTFQPYVHSAEYTGQYAMAALATMRLHER